MKKLLSMVLAIMMVLSVMPVAYAADTNITVDTAQTASTVVTYGLEEGYTVVIPDAVALDADGKGTATISAENVIIASGKTLNIRISGADYSNAWELRDTTDNDNVIVYTISKTVGGEDLANNAIVLSSASGVNWNSKTDVTLNFAITETIEKSGTYEDTLTFTVSID